MKKLTLVLASIILGLVSISVSACPKGEHPHGGTGSHHKGGYCA